MGGEDGRRGGEGLEAPPLPLPVGPIQRSQDPWNICLSESFGKGDRLLFKLLMM